ncbi:MAG: DUF4252 domain-containing protein [Bacteroidota bacterium]
MKYLIVLALALLSFSTQTSAQDGDAISKYFEQYVENEDFTVVYVSPKMFEILGKLELDHLEDQEAQIAMDMASRLKSIRVLTTEIDPGHYYEEAVNKINTNEYESLVKVRDEGENINLMIKDNGGDIITEMLVIVGGEDEFVLVSLIGDIDLKNISKLSKTMNIKGIEHLEKAENAEINN